MSNYFFKVKNDALMLNFQSTRKRNPTTALDETITAMKRIHLHDK